MAGIVPAHSIALWKLHVLPAMSTSGFHSVHVSGIAVMTKENYKISTTQICDYRKEKLLQKADNEKFPSPRSLSSTPSSSQKEPLF